MADGAEVRKAIFAKYPPIAGNGIFDAAAGSPAHTGRREAISNEDWNEWICQGQLRVKAESDTAGAIDQHPVEGDTEAAANRAVDVLVSAVIEVICAGRRKPGKKTDTVLLRVVPSTEPSRPNTHWSIWI
jgi:hypothetical protein